PSQDFAGRYGGRISETGRFRGTPIAAGTARENRSSDTRRLEGEASAVHRAACGVSGAATEHELRKSAPLDQRASNPPHWGITPRGLGHFTFLQASRSLRLARTKY